MPDESRFYHHVTHQDIKRRQAYSVIGVVISSVIYFTYYFSQLGAPDLVFVASVTSIFYISYIFLLYCSWSGRSARLADPSLVMPFMMWAILKWAVLAYITPELRQFIFLGILNIMCFAIFVLKWRGFVAVSLFMLTCFVTVMYCLYTFKTEMMTPIMDILTGATLTLCLCIHCLVGRELSSLRHAFRQRNKELQRAMVRIEELVVTDELTGIFNRRYLLSELEKHRALANRNQLTFSIAFLDIDHFKEVNDEFGHNIGDQVLVQLAHFLQSCIRDEDIVARYGGEEFVLILSGLKVEDASPVLERIRSSVENRQFVECLDHLTVSMGATEYRQGEAINELLDRADSLLYQAKKSGRNCIRRQYLPAVSS